MEREQVLKMCCSANTLAEVNAAWEARSHWLQTHPNDWGIVDVGEMLSMLEDAIKMTDDEEETIGTDIPLTLTQPRRMRQTIAG